MRSVVGSAVVPGVAGASGAGASAICSRVLAIALSYADVSAKACFASRQRVSRLRQPLVRLQLFDQRRIIRHARHDRHIFKVLRR